MALSERYNSDRTRQSPNFGCQQHRCKFTLVINLQVRSSAWSTRAQKHLWVCLRYKSTVESTATGKDCSYPLRGFDVLTFLIR